MKILLFAILFMGVVTPAWAKITHCEGKYKSTDGSPRTLKIDIIHPEQTDKDNFALLSLTDPETGKIRHALNEDDLVKIGYIEVDGVRYRLIITTRIEGNSLVGMYFWHNRIFTISAALWDEERDKPFIFLDTFRHITIRGNCL